MNIREALIKTGIPEGIFLNDAVEYLEKDHGNIHNALDALIAFRKKHKIGAMHLDHVLELAVAYQEKEEKK